MEDLENWHGKPLGDQSKAAIEACTKAIVNPGPHNLKPHAIVDDAPVVNLPVVKLDTPPNYKLGDKVMRWGLGEMCSKVEIYRKGISKRKIASCPLDKIL